MSARVAGRPGEAFDDVWQVGLGDAYMRVAMNELRMQGAAPDTSGH